KYWIAVPSDRCDRVTLNLPAMLLGLANGPWALVTLLMLGFATCLLLHRAPWPFLRGPLKRVIYSAHRFQVGGRKMVLAFVGLSLIEFAYRPARGFVGLLRQLLQLT